MKLSPIFSGSSVFQVAWFLHLLHFCQSGHMACLNETDLALVNLAKGFYLELSESMKKLALKQEVNKHFYYGLSSSESPQEPILLPSPNAHHDFKLHLSLLFDKIWKDILPPLQRLWLFNMLGIHQAKFKKLLPILMEFRLDREEDMGMSVYDITLIPEHYINAVSELCISSNLKEGAIQPLGVEFDISSHADEWMPAPFFRLSSEFAGPDRGSLFIALMNQLLGLQVPKTFLEKVKWVQQAVPVHHQINFFGIMARRAEYYVKFTIENIEISAVIPFLKKIDWSLEMPRIELLLNRIKEFPCAISVAVDIQDEEISKVAILFKTQIGYQFLFDLFIEVGLCTHEMSKKFLNTEHILWEPGGDYYLTQISHVKVNFTKEGTHAKIYLLCESSGEWNDLLSSTCADHVAATQEHGRQQLILT